MTTLEKKNLNDATGMIRTLCVVFLAIVLKNYSIGNFSWQWTILMIVVIVSLFVFKSLMALQRNSR